MKAYYLGWSTNGNEYRGAGEMTVRDESEREPDGAAIASRADRDFRRFVERRPRCLERSSFAALDQPREIAQYPLQSWPAFVDAAEAAEHGRIATGCLELIAALPDRLLSGDAAVLAELFALRRPEAEVIQTLLEQPSQRRSLVARGDFIEDGKGIFRCLEFNVSSNLGGWQNVHWAEIYLRLPVLQEFFASTGPWSCIDTLEQLFEHLIARHRWRCQEQDEDPGPLHIAFVAPAENRGRRGWFEAAQKRLDRLVAERHPDLGSAAVLGGTFDDIEERGGNLYRGPHRVRVVVESTGGRLDGRVFASAMAGRALVINGPVDRVLSNKKCLALLSEHAEDPRIGSSERELIERHLPWTRVLGECYADYRGERGYLPEILEDHRARFVLKPALGMRGEGIVCGHSVSDDVWREQLDRALEDPGPGWVVQERVESRSRLFQVGDRGCAPHDVVWGFFAFGRRYGGGFLRMLPKGEHGVVNAARGATESPIFIAEE